MTRSAGLRLQRSRLLKQLNKRRAIPLVIAILSRCNLSKCR
jgi:hypothetical protein